MRELAMKFPRKSKRANRGSIIVLATVLALTIVVLGGGFLFFELFMGAQKETKNAVDAGVLNVAKQVLDKSNAQVSVMLPGGPTSCFWDVTCDEPASYNLGDGIINLKRVNRMWGKAMLIAINAAAAQSDGNAGSGPGNAQQAFNQAQTVSDQLTDKLNNQTNLHGFFANLASQNSVRMLGLGAEVKPLPGNGWQTSLMERGAESNITLNGSPPSFNLPPGYSLNNSFVTKSTRNPVPASGANLWFLKGYIPLAIGNQTFWQVPFKYDEKPHHVSRSLFDASTMKNNPLSWNKAVPNAFSGEGEAIKKSPDGQKATSWVLTNPRENFQLSMPHSFVKIHLDDMESHWYFPLSPTPMVKWSTQSYGYTPSSQTSLMPGGGPLSVSVSGTFLIGLDVVGRTLDGVIFDPPFSGNSSKVEAYLTNRCNEMMTVPGTTKTTAQMHAALSDPSTILAMVGGVRDFYLFSPDGMSLSCKPQPLAIAQSPWLATMIGQSADGTETKLIDGATFPAGLGIPPMSTVVPDPFCTPVPLPVVGFWYKDVAWTPGSGYNGNLGLIRVKRWTEVQVPGMSVFP